VIDSGWPGRAVRKQNPPWRFNADRAALCPFRPLCLNPYLKVFRQDCDREAFTIVYSVNYFRAKNSFRDHAGF
jgi:hypothetical protein